jgi:hypothetical protein
MSKWTKKDVVSYFGNRGFDLVEKDIGKFEIIKSHLFVNFLDDEFEDPNEVVLFCLYNNYAEAIEGFNKKDFNWGKENLNKLLVNEGVKK